MDNEELNETETQIVALYLCQMLGQPTVRQVVDTMKNRMGIKTNIIKVKNALNSAKKRGLVSVGHIQDGDNSQVVDSYSMKDMRFTNPPEVAHIKNILPKLLEDESSKRIFAEMEGEHLNGEHKGGRLPDIRDYVTVMAKFRSILPVLGGEPFPEQKGVSATNGHRRIGDKIWIPANLWLRAAIREKLRQYNINASKALYIDCDDLFLKPQKPMIQVRIPSPPSMKGGSGTGIGTFEGIQPEQEFDFTIRFPTTNGIPVETMRLILQNLRIGAKHKDYGLIQLTKFQVV